MLHCNDIFSAFNLPLPFYSIHFFTVPPQDESRVDHFIFYAINQTGNYLLSAEASNSSMKTACIPKLNVKICVQDA